MSISPPRLVVIVHPDHPEVFDLASRQLGDTATVIYDRRVEERRRSPALRSAERRRIERRRLLPARAREGFRIRGCRLVFDPRGLTPTAGIQYAPALCIECEQGLEFEMPVFYESPARVEIEVQHHLSGFGASHTVELEALTASGRPILTSQIRAREARW